MSKNLNHTDDQYLALLKRARTRLDTISSVDGYDSTEIGDKYTETNVGLCDESLTILETALFPEQWDEGRRTMKYLGGKGKLQHICPLDTRWTAGGGGCYYHCAFFRYGLRTIEKIKKLYALRIKEVENAQ